jgi:hypothetical protein
MGASPQTPGLAALKLGSINNLFDPGILSIMGASPHTPRPAALC